MDGILFGWQTICIESHRMQHIESFQTFISGINVGCDVAEWVADVQTGSGRIREHIQYIKFRFGRIDVDFVCRMAKIEDCPGFETFGADVKAARKAKQLSRSALADMIHCDSRYLANIENEGTLPSLPVVIQLIKICGLPVERYFNPELMREESAERQRVSHKLQLCPEEYLPIVEGAIDGALRIHEQEKEPACV